MKTCQLCSEETCKQSAKYCFYHFMAHEKAKKLASNKKAITKAKLKIRKEKKKEKKANNLTTLTKKLDKVFSDYIRQRDKGVCFTCGVKKDWKLQQCGHFIRRSSRNTRWDETNCHCQCVACNIFKGGNYPAYSLALINEYGAEIIEELNRRGNIIKKWSAEELKDLIKKYESHIN